MLRCLLDFAEKVDLGFHHAKKYRNCEGQDVLAGFAVTIAWVSI